MPLNRPGRGPVVHSNGPALDRQSRDRSQIRSEWAVMTEPLPNEHAMDAIMMFTCCMGRPKCLSLASRLPYSNAALSSKSAK